MNDISGKIQGDKMNHSHMFTCRQVAGSLTVTFLATVLLSDVTAVAQNPQLEEKLIKDSLSNSR